MRNATVRTIPTYGLQARTHDKNNMKPYNHSPFHATDA